MKTRRILSALVGAAATAAALWMYASHRASHRAPPAAVPIQDGKTIDFSGGSPVVKDGAADKAAMDAALEKMDAAASTVTFPADPPPKK